MKKFASLLILVFAAAAYGQNDLTRNVKSEDSTASTAANSGENAAEAFGDASVARVLDDEFERLGYSESARLSILGDVGRENSWNRDIIFKGHYDPRNRAFNRGIISWQGNRKQKLDAYLKQHGLLGRGDDEELRGMARFMHSELQDEYSEVYKELSEAQDTASASNALQKYIKYVPARPYNSPDPEFKVRKNAVWAKRAQALGLGQPSESSSLQARAGNEELKKPEQSSGTGPQKSL